MTPEYETVTIERLVYGGQGIGTLPSGQKIFVWNALPGEVVQARIIKRKRSYLEAIAEDIQTPSAERIEPLETNYLATSPWQMMDFAVENGYKRQLALEAMEQEKVSLPVVNDTLHDDRQWHYRNKMEYSFWGDDDGLHLALHQRGSHGKHIVTGSKLALPAIDAAANAICMQLTKLDTRAGDLKTIIVRANQRGEAVAALFTKLPKFTALTLPPELKGLRVYHSNPKSPASVATELLQETGDCQLQDELLGRSFSYDVDSFFQVNPPLFEQALQVITDHCSAPLVTDMYAGVGSIGLSVAKEQVTLVELDLATAAMAAANAAASPLQTEVVETSAEKSLQYISADKPVIFDPPRAGLHPKVVEAVLATLPPQIVYLSCNPATQARDLALLQSSYDIKHFSVYNFFPRTPHIETLAVLYSKNG